MKNTVKKLVSVLIVVMMLFSVSTVAFAETNQQSAEATVSRNVLDFSTGNISPQASDVLTVTSSLTLNAAAPDPSGIITVKVTNCTGSSYNINWNYATGPSRVVDPPEIVDSSFSSGTVTWKISVSAVQAGTTSIPFTVTNRTSGATVGTKYCNITVTAPTLTVTPSNIVIDLNNSNSVTLNAVVSNFSGTDTIDIGFGTSSSKLYCEYGNYLNNGTELIVSSETAGTYYLYVGLRNPSTGYDILTQTYTVTVKAKTAPVTLNRIGIYKQPNKVSYTTGESLDLSGLELIAYYSDGSTQIIRSGFTYSTPNMSTAGTKTVTVNYGGKTASFNITVNNPAPATLSAISIYSNPNKVSYMVGESFDPTGLKIKAYYSDGSTQILSCGFTYTVPDMSTAGTKTITVKYGGKTATFSISVVSPAPTEIKATSVEIYVVRDFGDTNEAQLGARINPSNATYSFVTWTSSNTAVATVDSDGTITTYDVYGEAVITVRVTNKDGSTVSDTVTVTVEEEDNGDEPQSIWDSILQIIMAIIDFLMIPFSIFF